MTHQQSNVCPQCGKTFIRTSHHAQKHCSRQCLYDATKIDVFADGCYKVEDRGYKTLCWIWTGATKNGYAYVKTVGRIHRAYYEKANGPIPDGTEPDHLCKVKCCINPEHLDAVPHLINVRRQDRTRLTIAEAREIRLLYSEGMRQADIARQYNVFRATISMIVRNVEWREDDSPHDVWTSSIAQKSPDKLGLAK